MNPQPTTTRHAAALALLTEVMQMEGDFLTQTAKMREVMRMIRLSEIDFSALIKDFLRQPTSSGLAYLPGSEVEKPYLCSCGRRFRTAAALNGHQRAHTAQKGDQA